MGILTKFNDWRTSKRLTRLESDLKMLGNKVNFDPRYAYGLKELDNPESYTRRMEEYRTWFIGNSRLLRNLYKDGMKSGDALNYFWHKAPPTQRMLHSGIPGLISTKMATLMFGSGFSVEPTVYKPDSEDKDEIKSKQAKDLTDNLISICSINERLEEAAENESWGGDVFGKFSHKISLSDYPIFETADVRKGEAMRERGILVAVKFKFWYEHKQKHYRLDEIYTRNDDGDAMIKYELYYLAGDNSERRVPLETIPEGEELKYSDDGVQVLNDDDSFVYVGLKCMLAFHKKNKTPSHEFIDSDKGASDYEGAIDSFDALDEAYSELISELRTNKTIRYIPSNMCPRMTITNRDGSVESVPMLPDEFITNYVMTEGSEDQNAKNEIVIKQIEDKTLQHFEKWKIALTTAINKAGLSPLALGITGLEAANAGQESQRERNKASLETRNKKIKLWTPFGKDIFMVLLQLNSWMQHNTNANQKAFAKLDLDFENLDISVNFNDYIIEGKKEKIETWGAAKERGVASIETAIDEIHPEWTVAKRLQEVQRIKYQNAIAMDTPDTLQMDDLLNHQGEGDIDDEDAD